MDASQIIYHRDIVNFVKELMQEGKDSPVKGWVMSDIWRRLRISMALMDIYLDETISLGNTVILMRS